jgi:hypothetical protein
MFVLVEAMLQRGQFVPVVAGLQTGAFESSLSCRVCLSHFCVQVQSTGKTFSLLFACKLMPADLKVGHYKISRVRGDHVSRQAHFPRSGGTTPSVSPQKQKDPRYYSGAFLAEGLCGS